MTRPLPLLCRALVALAAAAVLAGAAAPAPAGRVRPSAPVVRLPFPQEDGSLTPYTFELGYPLMTLVYDTLLWRDAEGTPQPWLAASVDTSPDGRRVTVRLAEGATWHDGAPVTADDVAFTFAFVADHPHPRFTAELRAVESASAVDPSNVVVSLREPSPGFADQPLADLPVLPAHLWRGLPRGKAAPDGLPVGSGPYRLVEHRPGEAYRFEANDGYFRGRPLVPVVEVPIVTDAERTVAAMERGQVDMLPVSLPRQSVARLEAAGARVVEGPSYLGTVLTLNVRRPPFDRVEVRRAVSRALDLGRIADNVGDAEPADRGLIHPASAWSSPDPVHVADEAGARSALAGQGLPTMPVLVADNDPVKLEAARQVALALRRAGAEAEVLARPRAEVAVALGEDGSVPTFTAAITTTPPLASYDPDSLRRLFSSDPAEGSLNTSGYRSVEFDRLAAAIGTTADPAARRGVVVEALRRLADEAPVVPLFFPTGAFAFRPLAHDRWVFVRGTGILDKRSFLDRPAVPTSAAPPVVRTDDGGGLALGWAALGVLAAAGVLAGVALRRRDRG